MQWIVDHFYLFILALGIAHLCLLVGLWQARQRRARDLSFYLSNLVKHFSTSPDRHPGGTVHEQIDSFIADIREVMHDPERSGDRGKLYYRLIVKDESKRDIQGTKLDTYYNVARTGIEAYPLLGILGTIFAIALGLNAPRHAAPRPGGTAPQSMVAGESTPAADAADDELPAATSGAIIRNFANSIWSTASGIGFAIILMVVNAFIEPGFDRLVSHRKNVREVIASAKIALGLGHNHSAQAVDPRELGAGERREHGADALMISRRRMVFQLTALLDLLLVVLFAQYMETQEVTRRAIRAEAGRRAREVTLRIQAEKLTRITEAERQESEKLKKSALADRSQLTDQIEKLTAENQRLESSLTRAQASLGQEHQGRVEDRKHSAEELAQIGEIFRQRLNIDPKTLNAYLEGATPGEREKLLAEMQNLKGARSASVVQYLRATVEFKKMCNLWEIHIFDDNSVRLRFDGKDYGSRFYIGSANDFANRLIEAARDNGEPRSLVVVLLTWSDADRKTRDDVSAGLQEATTVLRTAWGNTKRIEVSKLGYTPEAP